MQFYKRLSIYGIALLDERRSEIRFFHTFYPVEEKQDNDTNARLYQTQQ